MKIYINHFNLTVLLNLRQMLKDLLAETYQYSEVYTTESIYHIDHKTIFLLEPKDGEIIIYKNYFNNITLVVDHSYFEKKIENSILGSKHVHKQISKYIYRLNPTSRINLVIEIANSDIPNDIYFETRENMDVKELFIQQEIIEFLSLLN